MSFSSLTLLSNTFTGNLNRLAITKTFPITVLLENSSLLNHIIRKSHNLSMVKQKLTSVNSSSSSSSSSLNNSSLDAYKSLKSVSSLKSLSTHSSNSSSSKMLKVFPLRALEDNYMYLLVDEATKSAAAVDPVNASAMASAVHDYGVDLKAILTTHHHYDHAHGNADMLAMFPEITIYGGDTRIQALTRAVSHGDKIKLGSLNIECLSTPCHTKGHICYYVTTSEPTPQTTDSTTHTNPEQQQQQAAASIITPSTVERAVFTGDTLFIAGCGRFFEGSSEQMDQNLNTILGNLPPETKVYCGHEYTVTNLKFALTVEPQNADIKSKLSWAQNKVSKKEPTVPSTIGEEKRINPFMRLKRTQVKKFTNENDELEVMTVLRHRKNEFNPNR